MEETWGSGHGEWVGWDEINLSLAEQELRAKYPHADITLVPYLEELLELAERYYRDTGRHLESESQQDSQIAMPDALFRADLRQTLPDNHFGSDIDAIIEFNNFFVQHANTSRRHCSANCSGRIRSMNAIQGVLFSLEQIERSSAKGVVGAALHAFWKAKAVAAVFALDHFFWWMPGRPFGLAANLGCA